MNHRAALKTALSAGLAFLVAACAAPHTQKVIAPLLPEPGFAEGWNIAGPVAVYDRNSLFEHIDGEAELYYPFGFRRATVATYASEADPSLTLSADVYEMGSTLDAFGIYSNYRYPPGPEFLPIGCEGFGDDYQVMFYQDRYFVRLSALGTPEQNRQPLIDCAKAISSNLPAPASPPAELRLLAIEETIPRTERYIAQSLLGYHFFPRGLTADARLGDQPIRLFVVITDNPAAAKKALDDYSAYLNKAGAPPQLTPIPAGRRLTALDPLFKGVLVQQKGPCLFGAIELDTPAAAVPLVQRMTCLCE